MTTGGVEVIGADRLAATMAAAARSMTDMSAVNQRIAVRMANASRGRAPRRTGRLAGSTRPIADRTTATVTAGGPGIPYAGVIHWGWPGHNIAPQPWLAETLQASQPAAVAAIDTRITHIVSTIHGAT
jgi:phage gpG-like protein